MMYNIFGFIYEIIDEFTFIFQIYEFTNRIHWFKSNYLLWQTHRQTLWLLESLDLPFDPFEFINKLIKIHQWINHLCHTYKQSKMHTLWCLESPDLINCKTEKTLFRFFNKFIKWIQWLDLIIFFNQSTSD